MRFRSTLGFKAFRVFGFNVRAWFKALDGFGAGYKS